MKNTDKKLVVIFGDGLVGSRLLKKFNECTMFKAISFRDGIDAGERITSNRSIVDLSRVLSLITLDHGKPDLVINAIGTIGKPNVDWCEDHKEETFYGNVEVAMGLVSLCTKLGIPMIHVSTGCIFTSEDKNQLFSTAATPNFTKSYYS